MSVRSVNVRYSANVSQLVSSLGAAAAANDRLEASTDRSSKALDRKTKAAGLLVVGLGASIAKFAEFDSVMSQVAAATGATGKDLDALRDSAIQAGRDTQFSAVEAAQGVTQLAKAGVSAKDIIGGGLAGALDLAAAGEISVGEAAETAATAMTQFKLEGSQVSHVADLLAAGANKAQGGVHDLGMALKQSGLVASQTGLTIEETTAGLTAFAAAGLIGSDAGTSFKTMLQRLTPQSEEARSKMDELGISAYDSAGNFIGLANFAENLRISLRNLTPEQRNAALATIFGSDAVRAAAVLYSNGGEGIAKWTKEVNESGYAAQQASTLTDNLRGDLTQLKSSFETVLIDTGSGANDVLRTTVQTVKALVDAIGALPGPVIAGALAFGALTLIGPKVGELASKITGPLTTGARRFRDEMQVQRALATQVSGGYRRLGDEAATTGAKVRGASVAMAAARTTMGGLKGAAGGLLGVLGGPWGLALAGATALLGGWAKAQQDAKQDADDLTATIDKQTGAWTKASREVVANKIRFDVSPEDLARLEQAGVALEDVTSAVLAGGPAFDQQVAALTRLREEGGATAQAARGLWLTMLRERDAAVEANAGFEAQAKLVGETGAASEEAAPQLDQLAMEEQQAAAEAAAAAERHREFNAELAELYNVALSARGAARDLAAAVDEADAALEKNGKTLDINTEAGRENQAALDGIAAAAVKSAEANLANGKSVEDVTKDVQQARTDFIRVAVAMGMHEDKANELADQLGLTRGQVSLLNDKIADTPTAKTTTMTVLTGDALVALSRLKGLYDSFGNKTVSLSFVYRTQGKDAAQAYRNTFQAAGGIGVAYAGGGMDVPNGHLPHIAPAGAYRVFAEQETGGEAYTPLANDWRRPRAKAITEEVARRFGGRVEWNAAGSITGPSFDYGRLAAAVGAGGRTLTAGDVAAIAAAVRDGAFEGVAAGGVQAGRVARVRDRQREGVG